MITNCPVTKQDILKAEEIMHHSWNL